MIGNIHYNMRDEITDPFPNFNGATAQNIFENNIKTEPWISVTMDFSMLCAIQRAKMY